jgi:hypothetical protein
MFRHLAIAFALVSILPLSALSQDSDSKDKTVDLRSSVGDLHIGPDADAKKIGLPLYPGARLKSGGENQDKANLSILTEAFGMKLIVAKYETDDAPEKVLSFYRDKMKKYGKVLECHHTNENDSLRGDSDDDHDRSKPLKCEGDNSGPIRELKVGTEDNAHILALEDPENHKGTSFALVYLHTRGKTGDI